MKRETCKCRQIAAHSSPVTRTTVTSMNLRLQQPVGRICPNLASDVKTVQTLLNRHIGRLGPVRPLLVDGRMGEGTLSAILLFQEKVVKLPHPDGRIDPLGITWRHLTMSHGAVAPSPGHDIGSSKLSAADYEAAAKSLGDGIDARLIRAFAEVESGGKSGFGPDGMPVIAFEGHVFKKLTGGKYDKSHPLLSYPYKGKAGPEWQKNNKDHTTAWQTLNAAIGLDETAALQSSSWGMFQVMGFNYQRCGYANVKAFVAAMKAGEKGQIAAFVGYCRHTPGMLAALQNKKYAEMASLYNGDDYGDYDQRIHKAYQRHGGV